MMGTQLTIVRYRWTVAAACFVLAVFAWGLGFYSFGFYIATLQETHDWSISLLSASVAGYSLMSAISAVFVGRAIARFGPSRVALFGATGLMLGCFGQATLVLIDRELARWVVFVPFLLSGAGFAAMSTAVISATLLRKFGEGFGLALGFALNGASVGGMIIPPVLVWLTETYGYAVAMSSLGAALIIAVVPLAHFIIRDPGEGIQSPGQGHAKNESVESRVAVGIRQLMRRPAFWRIVLAGSLALGAQVAFFTQLIPDLKESLGFSSAAFAITIAALFAVAGRFMMGFLSTRWPVPWLAAACYSVQALGIVLVLLLRDSQLAYVGAALAGLVIGSIVMVPPLLLSNAFDKETYPIAYGWVTVFMQMTVLVITFSVGLLKDGTGSYVVPFLGLVFLHMLASGTVLTGKGVPKKT